jgi:iron complex outermembrane receptor protein
MNAICSRNVLLGLALALTVSTLGARTATAQTDPPDEDETRKEAPRFEAEVRVEAELPAPPTTSTAATRIPVAVEELPVSVSVVPRRLFDERAALVLGDALKNASGVNVATGFGVFDFFVIRGFDSLSSGLVLTDGIPEPESTFYPLYNLRQVEVLKGPASFLYGGNPLSGAAQLVRKQPESKRFADVTLGYGRFATFEGAVDANVDTSDGKLAARLNAVYQGTDGYRDPPSGSIKAANPTLVWRPDDHTRLGLDLEYVRSEWPPDTGIPFVGEAGSTLAPVPRTRSYQSPLDSSSQDVSRFRFEVERQVGDRVTLRNRFYYTDLTWDSDGTLIAGVFPGPDDRLLVARTLVLLDDRQRLLGNQLEVQATFETGSIQNDLLSGVELQSLKDRFTQDVGLLPPMDLLEPVETFEPPLVTIPPLGQVGDSRSLVVAPYLIDRIRFSPKIQAFVGARLNVLDYEDPANETERQSTSFNPLLGAVYSPTPALALHASWGTGSAPPSTQVVGARDPEESRQVELGAKLSFVDGRGFAGLSVYELERRNVGIPDVNGITRQSGSQRSRGVELDLTAEPVRGWQTRATYAFTDSVLTRFSELVPLAPPDFLVLDHSGNRAPFAPRHIFGLWTSKRFASSLSVALGLRHLSDQVIAGDNRHVIEGYTTLDAAVSYEVGPLRFGVSLKNLTGTEYETRGFGSSAVIPARPFEVLGRVVVGLGRH